MEISKTVEGEITHYQLSFNSKVQIFVNNIKSSKKNCRVNLMDISKDKSKIKVFYYNEKDSFGGLYLMKGFYGICDTMVINIESVKEMGIRYCKN